MATGQQEADGTTGEVRQGVDLRCPAAARTTDGLAALPPFPPAAQRWALTAELSINTSAGGPSAEARQIARGEDRARAAGRALRRAMNKLQGDR